MNRRTFITANTAATFIATLGYTAAAETPAVEEDLTAVGAPCLLNPDTDSITVVWSVRRLSLGVVEYGSTEELGTVAAPVKNGMVQRTSNVVTVHIDGLEPGSTCFYRTVTYPLRYHRSSCYRDKPVASRVYSFKVMAKEAKEATFSVINDTHENQPIVEELFKRLQDKPAEAVFWNGDFVNDLTKPETLREQTLDKPSPTAVCAESPMVYVYGNHDVRGQYANEVDEVIPLRPTEKRYFTFQNGPVMFMVLDTGEDKGDGHGGFGGMIQFQPYRTEQAEWIAEQIETEEWKAAAFRVVFCHIPLHGEWNSPDSRNKWHGLLVKGGIDAIISGHTHKSKRMTTGYAHLVGGGPHINSATLIRGHATEEKLTLKMEWLHNKGPFGPDGKEPFTMFSIDRKKKV